MCEIMAPDGHMARRDYIRKFADEHGIKFISVAELIAYRMQSENLLQEKLKQHYLLRMVSLSFMHTKIMLMVQNTLRLLKMTGQIKFLLLEFIVCA